MKTNPALPPGVVFTPQPWAAWALQAMEIPRAWEDGATVMDPTAGQGVFALALMESLGGTALGDCNQERRLKLSQQIVLGELRGEYLEDFAAVFPKRFGFAFPRENLLVRDILAQPVDQRFDFLVGNPPWVNFTDLDQDQKAFLKPLFLDAGLVADPRKLLWGGSRIDLAALVLAQVLTRNLKSGGRAGFFLPASLFFNEGAHERFRRLQFGQRDFSLDKLHLFGRSEIFPGVAVPFCFAEFTADRQTIFPLVCQVREKQGWKTRWARPLEGPDWQKSGAPLVLGEDSQSPPPLRKIVLKSHQFPRQGVNTGGANALFHFTPGSVPQGVPPEFLYPLMTTAGLQALARTGHMPPPQKLILVPHRADGSPLNRRELENSGLAGYFDSHREKLLARKGTLLGKKIAEGIWWSLLGVGPYAFSPWKLVWQAYGSHRFEPLAVGSWEGKPWMANQALQAFIPLQDAQEGGDLCREFRLSGVENLLQNQQAGGTCNWAQPGRIRRFLQFQEP